METGIETDRAWAAGFYDGEGSTIAYISGRRYMHPRMQVAQSGDYAPEVLERFREAVGSGHIKGPYQHRQLPHAKPVYYWYAYGWETCLKAWRALWPYLSEQKRDQSRAVWAKCRVFKKERTTNG